MKEKDSSNEIAQYLDGLKSLIENVDVNKVNQFINLLLDAYENERRIFIFGNGGSAATASHFVADLNKGTCCDLNKRFKAICLNDNIPTMLAYANDKGYETVFVEHLKNFLREGDLVIGISGSGNSPNVLNAIEYANSKGAKTIGLIGYDGGKLAGIASFSVIAEVNDMQKAEDLHVILTHVVMQVIRKEING